MNQSPYRQQPYNYSQLQEGQQAWSSSQSSQPKKVRSMGEQVKAALITAIGTVLVAIITYLLAPFVVNTLNKPGPAPILTPTPVQAQVSASTQPSFPTLHPSYVGTMSRTMDGAMLPFSMSSLSENQTNGAFTAEALINGCPADVKGSVTATGELSFRAKQPPTCGGGLEGEFTGNINANGSIGGQWMS